MDLSNSPNCTESLGQDRLIPGTDSCAVLHLTDVGYQTTLVWKLYISYIFLECNTKVNKVEKLLQALLRT